MGRDNSRVADRVLYPSKPFQNAGFIPDAKGNARLQLFGDPRVASQFVGEVVEKDHGALSLLMFRCLDWH